MTTQEAVTLIDERIAVDADLGKAELTDSLRLIGRALRTLRTRVNELEAEVTRQLHAAEQARAVTAAETARRVLAEREIDRLLSVASERDALQAWAVELQRQLEELRATRLFRWSVRPRRWYGVARRLTGARP
jgi:hypothetical protein